MCSQTDSSLSKDIISGNAFDIDVRKECIGTIPFMSVETFDSDSPGYQHHLCHDLESIFYVMVWHAVGYPREIDVTKFDRHNILKCWRTLVKVKTAKVVFINNPMDVFPLITCHSLTLVVAKLLMIVNERHHSVLVRYLAQIRMEAKQQQVLQPEPGAQLAVQLVDGTSDLPSTKNAIFPEFARAWGMIVMKCEENCCVDRSMPY